MPHSFKFYLKEAKSVRGQSSVVAVSYYWYYCYLDAIIILVVSSIFTRASQMFTPENVCTHLKSDDSAEFGYDSLTLSCSCIFYIDLEKGNTVDSR